MLKQFYCQQWEQNKYDSCVDSFFSCDVLKAEVVGKLWGAVHGAEIALGVLSCLFLIYLLNLENVATCYRLWPKLLCLSKSERPHCPPNHFSN